MRGLCVIMFVTMPKQIDLEPHSHSSSYELKPESRWWLVVSLVFAGVMALASGIFSAATWAMFLAGALVSGYAILCFPHVFLKKDR